MVLNVETLMFQRQDDDGETIPFMIVPTGPLMRETMVIKYEAYNSLFGMMLFSQKTVKIKWYQSMFFRFIMMLISMVVAPVAFAINMGLQIASSVFKELGAIFKAIISIYQLVTTGFSGNMFQNILDVGNNMLTIVSTYNQIAFQSEYQKIQNRIEALTEEEKEMREELDSMSQQPLYIPMGDRIDFGYNGLYDLPHTQLDRLAMSTQVDTSIYNYT